MPSTTNLMIQLALNTRSLGRNVERDMKRVQAKLKQNFQKVIGEAAGGNFTDKMIADTRKRMENLQNGIEIARKKAGEAAKKSRDVTSSKEERKQSEAIRDAAKLEHDELVKRYQTESANIKAVAERRAKSYDKELEGMHVKLGENAEAFGDSLREIFSDLTSKDLGTMLGVIGKMGQKVKKVGDMARAGQGMGSTGKMMDKLGGVLGKIGPALMAIGAIAAGFAAIVKLIIDADAQAKELHKTLIDSGASLGDMVGGAKDVRAAFDEIRDAAIDIRNNWKWGTLAADQLKILGAFNNTVLTLKKMGEGLLTAEERMLAYQKATSVALIYSKLLGESAEKVAEDIGTLMEDLGLSLAGVQEKFAAVYDAAQSSGYGTKRFFGMVLQATTGMSMYNVRLEQTATMLLNLNKILGSKFGPDFFQGLLKGFTDESMQDRFKRILITGSGATRKVMEASAKSTASSFVGVLQSQFQDRGQLQTAITHAFGDLGALTGELADATDAASRGKVADKLVGVLKGMSPDKQEKVLARLGEKAPPELVRQLRMLIGISKGAAGMTGDMMNAMSDLDPAATLALQMQQVESFFKKPIHMINDPVSLMALETMMGISGEQLKLLRAVSQSNEGSWKRLQEVRDEVKKGVMTPEQLEETNKQLAETHGAIIKDGKIVTASFDKNTQKLVEGNQEVSSAQELLLATSNRMKDDTVQAMTVQEALAQQVAANTTEMTTYLEQGVQYFLNGIFKAVQAILSWVSGGLNEDEKKNQQEALSKQNEIIQALQEQERTLRQKAAAAGVAVQTAKTPEERRVKQDALKAVNDEVEAVRGRLAVERKVSDAIQSNVESDYVTDKNAAKFRSQALEKVLGKKEVVERAHALGPGALTLQGMGLGGGAPEKIESVDLGSMVSVLEDLKGKAEATRMIEEAQLQAYQRIPEDQRATEESTLKVLAATYDFLKSQIPAVSETIDESSVGAEMSVRDQAKKKEEKDKIAAKKQEDLRVAMAKSKINPDLVRRLSEEEQKGRMREILAKGGVASDRIEAAVEAIMGGQPAGVGIPAEKARAFLEQPGVLGIGDKGMRFLQGQAGKTEQVQDFMARVGKDGRIRDVVSIDEQDTLFGAKPGGALAKAGKKIGRGGKGGEVTNIFNLYDTGRGALKVIQDAQDAGALP